MERKHFTFKLFAILIGITSLISCAEKGKTSPKDKSEEILAVRTENVKRVTINNEEVFTATVEAEIRNQIMPQAPNRILKMLVDVGDNVTKGQLLVQMDAVSLNQVELQLKNNQEEFNRIDELYKVGGASKSQWESRKMALDLTKKQYANLKQNTQLTSPINGIVTQRNYNNGDMVNLAMPILIIEQIAPVKLIINISERYYTKIKEGMPVTVNLEVFEEESFEGKVNLIYPTIDPATRTFKVEIKIQNTKKRIRPGMFARVSINFGSQEVIAVPDQAIVKQVGTAERFVYILKDGEALLKNVTIGRLIDNQVEITSGIEEDDQVITTGLQKLKDHLAVRPIQK